jgi:hypothetical protein
MLFLPFFLHLETPAMAVQCEQRSYWIRKGGESHMCTWERIPGEFIKVRTRQKSEECINLISPGFESLSLDVRDVNTRIEAWREGNTLFVGGTLNGRSMQRQYRLDDAPWFQVMSYSLQGFVLSNRRETEFRMLHPETFVAYKMTAVKEGLETISVRGRKFETQKIRLRIKGALSVFWHGDFWFRSGDGLLVFYRSLNGLPGSSETLVEYIGP